MKLLCPRYFGSIARCNFGCGALIGYKPEDVSPNQTIECPQCGARLWVPLNINYNGIINEEEQNNADRDNNNK